MRKRFKLVRVVAVGLSLAGLVTSCGDSGDGLIHSQACTETFIACGGDPVGTWDIVAVCTDGDIADEYNKVELPACTGVRESVTLAAVGSVKYTGHAAVYDGRAQESALMSYSQSCAEATQGIASLNPDACRELERLNTDLDIGKVAKCKFDSGNCRCSEATTVDVVGVNVYGVRLGSRIVEEDGSAYDFCIQDNTMRQREKIYGDAYVVTTLKKR